MSRKIVTHLLPDLFVPEELQGGAAVVIDILRASSTMTTALANGAAVVIPCETIETSLDVKSQQPAGTTILGGERQGVQIPGFDRGNSPRDYGPETVQGKTVIFTTTNGTRALHRCFAATNVFIGCFLNLSRLADHLLADSTTVHLVCAGTDRQVTLEDCLFAGALAEKLTQSTGVDWELNDASRICITLAEKWKADSPDRLLAGLQHSQGGRNLKRLGYDLDVAYCARTDQTPVIPQWHSEENRIQLL